MLGLCQLSDSTLPDIMGALSPGRSASTVAYGVSTRPEMDEASHVHLLREPVFVPRQATRRSMKLMSSKLMRPRRHTHLLAIAVLLAVLLALPPVAPVHGQPSVPPECRNDQGNAVVPASPSTGFTWVILLNFNHAPSTTASRGCLALRQAGAQNPTYQALTCLLQNNTKQASVGGGSATFKGPMTLLCSPNVSWNGTQTDFLVQVRASFAAPGSYQLVSHPDLAFQASLDADWRVALTSRYGQASFSSRDPNTNIRGKTVQLRSDVLAKVGTHMLESTLLQPSSGISTFPFNLASPFVVGSPGLTLQELIIDPTGSCCRS